MKVRTFIHGDKESLSEAGRIAGLEGAALDNFRFALYEVELMLEANPETGDAVVSHVDGRPVAMPKTSQFPKRRS